MFRPALFAAIAFSFLAPAVASASPASEVRASMAAADRRDWGKSRARAAAAGDQAAIDLYDWRLLSAGNGDWASYRNFVARNPDWPNLANIREEGERMIPPGTSLAEIDNFVGIGGPATGTGILRRADALIAAGRQAEAEAEIIRAWRGFSLEPNEFSTFRSRFGALLREHHTARADEMLWRGLTGEAQAMKPLVSPGWGTLIDARATLRRMGSADALIARVPGELANDPGLAWERFQWRMRKNLYAEATTLIQSRSGSAAQLGRPEVWGPRRALLVRRLARQGQSRAAYNLANQNHMVGGSDFSDLEFLAGWLALRKLNDPARAETHFRRLIAAVETPISLGRGYYWLGRALEARGDSSGAKRAYQDAAQHQTSFYGQLGAEVAGVAVDPAISAGPSGNWRNTSFANRTVTRAAQLLAQAGDRRRAHWFLTSMARNLESYDDLAGLANLAITVGRPDAAVRISKIAARKGHVIRGDYYPVTELASLNGGVEPALAMAIGRQESELNPEAVSPAGARGLMQVMPATARKVAGWIGQPYSQSRLTGDWRYNASLGQAYLARRVAQYDGSVAMAAAAYNAGAGRVDQWVQQYGDPRNGSVDWIDWMETIPFNETRNYVQRVLEGLQVYRNRLAGKPVAFRLKQDALGR